MGDLADLHIHSDNSPDGRHSAMLLCESALDKGIGCIAVTDHCEVDRFYEDNYNIAIKQSFFDTRKARNVFNGQLCLLNGVELGQAVQNLPLAEKVLDAFPLDVVLGSLHNIRGRKDFAFLDYSSENIPELLNAYFDELLELVRWGKFQILAHLSYPLRYIEGENGIPVDLKAYEARITEILGILIQKGIALEINTSGLRQKLNKTMPDLWCLRLFHKLGGSMITLGSDAHSGDDIGSGFHEAVTLAREAGFKGLTMFMDKKPTLLEF